MVKLPSPSINRAPGSVAYSPLADPGLDLWSLLEYGYGETLVSTALSNWQDRKNGFNWSAAGALQPVDNPAGITDELGGTHGGIVFTPGTGDGSNPKGLQCTDAGLKALFHANTGVRLVWALQNNTPAGLQCLFEIGTAGWFNAVGQCGVFLNETNSNSVETGIRGAGAGLGIFRSDAGTVPLVDPGIIQCDFGSTSTGSPNQTLDGTQVQGAPVAGGTSFTAGNFASATLFFGCRNNASLGAFQTFSAFAICGPTSTDVSMAKLRDYLAAKIKVVQG